MEAFLLLLSPPLTFLGIFLTRPALFLLPSVPDTLLSYFPLVVYHRAFHRICLHEAESNAFLP